jgi:hypothetical protein
LLDPVFLIDKSIWNTLAKKPKIEEKYILIYCLNEKKVYHIANEISKKTGHKILTIQNNLIAPIKTKIIYSAGVEEFLGLIKEATYVVSDSFHGISLAIIFNKQFYAQVDTKNDEKNSRLITLLDTLNLNKRLFSNESEYYSIDEIDYNEPNFLISIERNKALEYLNSIVN